MHIYCTFINVVRLAILKNKYAISLSYAERPDYIVIEYWEGLSLWRGLIQYVKWRVHENENH